MLQWASVTKKNKRKHALLMFLQRKCQDGQSQKESIGKFLKKEQRHRN